MRIIKESISSIEEIGKDLLDLTRQHYYQCNAYTNTSLNYRKKIAEDRNFDCSTESFVICLNNDPIIAFIGAKNQRNKITKYDAYSGRPCLIVMNQDKITPKLSNVFFKELDCLIEDNSAFYYRDPLVNGCISLVTKRLLTKGSRIEQFYTQVIDLEKEKAELKKDLRKSFKSLINWGYRELDICVKTGENIKCDDIELFKALHYEEAGKKTRSDESWQKQYDMIKNDDAFLVMAFYEEKLVASGFFTMSSNSCYYGASASRRDLFQKPLFHSVMWEAINHARILGCKWFETGEQRFDGSEKDLGISLFKAGFGGLTRSFLDVFIN